MEPNIMERNTQTSVTALGIYSGSYAMPGVKWLPRFEGEPEGAPATPPPAEPAAPPAAAAGDPPAEPGAVLEAEPPAEPPAPRTPWYTKRISELTRARTELETGLGQTKAEKELLEARIAELEGELAARGEGNPPATPPTAKPPAKPGPSQPDFARAVHTEAARLAAVAEFNRTCNDIYNAGVKAHGDAFKASIAAIQENFQGIPPSVVEAAVEAAPPGKAHEIINEIAKDLDFAADLFSMSTVKQATAIAKIATKLTAPTPVTAAPKPIEPVGGRSPTKEATLDDPDLDTKTWMERRQQEVIDKRKRGINIR